MPTGNLWSGGDSAEGDCQYRGMQRLANMANRVRGATVVMQERAATRKIQQHQA